MIKSIKSFIRRINLDIKLSIDTTNNSFIGRFKTITQLTCFIGLLVGLSKLSPQITLICLVVFIISMIDHFHVSLENKDDEDSESDSS